MKLTNCLPILRPEEVQFLNDGEAPEKKPGPHRKGRTMETSACALGSEKT